MEGSFLGSWRDGNSQTYIPWYIYRYVTTENSHMEIHAWNSHYHMVLS